MILIVEDNPEVANVFAQTVTDAGYQAVVVHDSTSALVALGRENIDLALVDLSLPDFNGVELITRAGAAGIDVPMILVSGAVALIDPAILKAAGFRAAFDKPVRPSVLLAAVKEHIGRKDNEAPST